MAGHPMYAFRIDCDGCGQDFPGTFPNNIECRAAAYAAGWRFPGKINNTGKVSAREFNYVCPECIGAWNPRLTSQAADKQAQEAESR